MKSKLAWGVLGTGKIVQKTGPAIQQSSNGIWLGVAGRNPENSRQAAEKYGVERAYAGYQELLDDPDIDAVYIALLNHLHKEWTVKAVQAGKHVLVEKPFALNMEEAREMKAAAEANGVFIMEAHVWHYYPAFPAIRQMVEEGAIGELAMMQGHFSFIADRSSTRLVKEWGGGSLYDVGCYPAAWSRYFFGEEPVGADGVFFFDSRTGVDTRFSGTLHYAGGRFAQISSALDMPHGSRFTLMGSKGLIEVRFDVTPERLTIHARGPFGERSWTTDRISPYTRQAEAFAAGVLSGEGPPRGAEDALNLQAILDALFLSHQEKRHIPLADIR